MCILLFFIYFFFSSRRRHTRSKRDWSSDVCSSDLTTLNDYSIQQYLRETPHYGIRHNLDVILGACSNQELENCYDMLHTYLIHSRRRKRRKGKNPSSEQ